MNRSTEQARTGGNGSRQERERVEHKGTGREREAAREREREIFWDINYLPPGPCFSAKLLISCSEWRKKREKKQNASAILQKRRPNQNVFPWLSL